MEENAQGPEEVVLFPDTAFPAADWASSSNDESLARDGASALREWLTLQLAQLEGQLRKQSRLPRPYGLTPEVSAYIQACESQVARKASKDAYMKALQKLDHFIQT